MMMLSAPIAFISPVEGLLVFLVILVLLFGSRAQDMAGEAGKAVGEFSRTRQQIEQELDDELGDVRDEVEEVRNDVNEDLEDVRSEVDEIESAVHVNASMGSDTTDTDTADSDDTTSESRE